MSVAAATKVIETIHTVDPKKLIQDDLKGWIERVQPTAGDILLCIYERPEKTKGNIIIPETASRRAEDPIQGVVGMIVRMGPDVARHKQALGLDKLPAVGDWVMIRRADGIAFVCGKRMIVQIQANFIRAVLQDPDVII